MVTLLATYERRRQDLAAGKDELASRRVGCRRVDMLNLTLDDYRGWAPASTAGLRCAAQFLHGEHLFDPRFLPYGSQLIPMAAVFAVLGTDAESMGARQKIARWYWCGVFGELYGGTTETRFARDLPELVAWVRGEADEPRTVQEAQFFASRLRSLRTRGSAAYKGLYALLVKGGAVDWRTGSVMSAENYFDCETAVRRSSRCDPCYDWPCGCLGVDLSAGWSDALKVARRAGSDLIGA